MRFDEGDVCEARGRLDYHGLKFRLVFRCVQRLLNILTAEAEAVHDLRNALLDGLHVLAEQQNAEGRIAIHEHAAFAIEHRTTRRDNRDGAHAIAFGEVSEMSGLDDLQLPKTN